MYDTDIGTYALLKYIHDYIFKGRKNFVIIICGKVGTGKSFAALRIAELFDPNFSIGNVVFSSNDFLDAIDPKVNKELAIRGQGKIPTGSVFIYEESGVMADSRAFFTRQNKILQHLLQTTRYQQFCTIFTLPDMDFMDIRARKLCNLIVSMVDHCPQYSTANMHVVQKSLMAEHSYYHTIAYKDTRTGKILHLRTCHFKKPSTILRHQYEKKKMDFNEKLKYTLRSEGDGKHSKNISNRQEDIMGLINIGYSSIDEIATELNINKRLVEANLRTLKSKGHEIPKEIEI